MNRFSVQMILREYNSLNEVNRRGTVAMHLRSLIFCLTLIVLLKRSSQSPYQSDEYDESSLEDAYEEVPTTPQPTVKKGHITEKSTVYETTNISADKGSNLVLECSPEYGKAKWLVAPTHELSITTTSDGIASLSVRKVIHDQTFECRRSDNIVERFVVTVNGPYAKIVSNSEFVKNGTNIQLSCVIRSNVPVTTSYLRVDSVNTTQRYIANWESKRRLCENNDYNRTDCFEETTFQFNVDVTDNAVFTCGYENIESSGHTVEVINDVPIIYEATKIFSLSYVQKRVVQFAVEALEKYGLKQDAATDIREKCTTEFKRFNAWNCIIGREHFRYSLSSGVNGEEYASLKFSIGTVFVAVFRTNK